MLPIDQVRKVIESLAEIVNTVYKLANGASIFTAIGLLEDLAVLKTIQKDILVAQLKDCDPTERMELVAVFKQKLVLDNKPLEMKIESGVDCLDEVIDLGYSCVALINQAKSVLEHVKSVIS